MSTDIAQFLWVEGRLSTMERLCLSSFLKNGYEVHLYTYGNVKDVPQGVEVKDGHEILPRSRVFQASGCQGQKGSYTAFANLFRVALLIQRGGWWFDMDMICLRHLPPPSTLTFASTWEGQYRQCPCNCAIWSPVADRHLQALYEDCDHIIQKSGDDLKFGECGVHLLKLFIREHALEHSVAPWWEFCPYPWRLVHRLAPRTASAYVKDRLRGVKHRIWELFDDSFKAAYVRPGSRSLHFHNEIWKAMALGKDEEFFPFSAVEQYKRKYLAR